MNRLILLTLVMVSTIAAAKQQAERPPIPPVDYHVPTKAELIPDFTESFKSYIERAVEYGQGSKEQTDFLIAQNTVTPEQIEQTAEYTANRLQRQLEICQSLQAKYPKTQVEGVNCVSGVLMVSGLGHAYQQKMVMEFLADKEKAKKFLAGLDGKDEKDQVKYSLKTLKNGIKFEGKYMESSDIQTIEQALGFMSMDMQIREAIAAALAK